MKKKSFLILTFCEDTPISVSLNSAINCVRSNTGTKLRIQKRTITMSIHKAFEIFKTTYPEITVGKPIFYKERPAYVLPTNDTPHNVWICTTHSNYMNLLLAISKHATEFLKKNRELLRQLSCSVDNVDCMSNSCDFNPTVN